MTNIIQSTLEVMLCVTGEVLFPGRRSGVQCVLRQAVQPPRGSLAVAVLRAALKCYLRFPNS